jgi:hypothetical protein
MYKRSKLELEEVKEEKKWTIEKLEIENKRIKRDIMVLKGKISDGEY